MEIIKNGEWDGQPILRQKTAGEILSNELYKMKKNTFKKCNKCDERGHVADINTPTEWKGHSCDCPWSIEYLKRSGYDSQKDLISC